MNPPQPTPQDSLLHARQLGRYQLIAEIGSGGMGVVLLARLPGEGGFQRLFAIKVPTTDDEDGGDDGDGPRDRLLDEARIAARIHHPNVVAILEIGRSSEHGYFLVMDYVEGFTLAQIFRRIQEPSPASWRITNRIIIDALEGLEAAHTLVDDHDRPLNVVHRDISPQNILVGVDGTARVTDFGIAKAAKRLASTRNGQVKGKTSYLSPEAVTGDLVEARADLFSMGIVLWESLTLRQLFWGQNDAETVNRIMSEPIPRAVDVAPGVSPALDGVAQRALQREPYVRFASAREMADSLEQVARSENLVASSREVGQWMREAFATELATRREAIRTAVSVAGTPSLVNEATSTIRMPTFPEVVLDERAFTPSRDDPTRNTSAPVARDPGWDDGEAATMATATPTFDQDPTFPTPFSPPEHTGYLDAPRGLATERLHPNEVQTATRSERLLPFVLLVVAALVAVGFALLLR